MKTSLCNIFSLGFLLLSMSACTPSGGSDGSSPGKKVFLGELDKKLEEIYGPENEPYFGACDKQWKDEAIELGRFLESHRGEIEAFYKDHLSKNTKEGLEIIQMGRFSFRHVKKETVGGDQWAEDSYSWADAYKLYTELKDKPVDFDWVMLNSMVRGIVPDEEERVMYGANMGLSKDAGPIVRAIHDKVKTCFDNENCSLPDLSESEKNFTSQGGEYFYVYRLYYSKKSYSFAERREYIEKLYKVMATYSKRYEFRPSDIAHVNGNQLEIPMDLSVFGEDASKFINYVESIWNNTADFAIKIIQTNTPLSTYLVKVDELVGERAFVQGKTMQLYNFNRMKVLPHEFGHVIGFRDNYYTIWSAATCKYTDQFNAGDIMSDHNGGQVLPHHWNELKKQYWKIQ